MIYIYSNLVTSVVISFVGDCVHVYYAPPLIGGGIKRCICLTSVCLSRTSGLTREQRPRKTKIATEVAHVTRDSGITFKVKMSRSPWPLMVTVMVTYPYAYMTYIVSPLAGLGGISWRPSACSLFISTCCKYLLKCYVRLRSATNTSTCRTRRGRSSPVRHW